MGVRRRLGFRVKHRQGNKMRTYQKIDLYFAGDYLCSTNWSRTCKEAVQKYIESIEASYQLVGRVGLVESRIIKNPKLLKGRFSK